jgi:hypothetical protein
MAKARKQLVLQRTLYIVEKIAGGMRPVNILQDKGVKAWGLSDGQVEKYIKKAHDHFRERANVNKDQEIGDAIAKYDLLIEKAMDKEYLKTAGMLIDKRAELIGLKKLIVIGEEDKPITVKWKTINPGSE